jgi:Ca2+-binding EF-hand superfamily protein
VKDINN